MWSNAIASVALALLAASTAAHGNEIVQVSPTKLRALAHEYVGKKIEVTGKAGLLSVSQEGRYGYFSLDLDLTVKVIIPFDSPLYPKVVEMNLRHDTVTVTGEVRKYTNSSDYYLVPDSVVLNSRWRPWLPWWPW